MPDTVSGLPTHALIVHATVVLIPLAAALLALSALWPRLRRTLGPLPTLGAAVALILVPITTATGDKLRDRLGVDNPLINRHADLGEQLLPWVAALFVAAVLLLWADGWRPTAWSTPAPGTGARAATATGSRMRVVALVVSVIVLALAVVTVVEVIRIGHAGAEAVWQGVGTS
ncbi:MULTISPECIES: DUF2231 domain-containing protein [unclassified Pseudofrankia]|uniref:DUF2231 domain-containing protein n=1 Tax=unclassified Pseudofrankia TaxID=2994372 RepID=UPI0009F5357F|nr:MULTISPECIES: DUF2231 domain-containing protein [unclassified Pseudofrankia]MDT3444795.1 hypothetical protein [Pseudofrankia sp. BMG5.37]